MTSRIGKARLERAIAAGVEMRPIVTIHLPLEMGAVGAVLRVISAHYPEAVVSDGGVEAFNGRTGQMVVLAREKP